jgi:DNA-binding response OmpR family regulator
VRNAAGELTDGFHHLRLRQAPFTLTQRLQIRRKRNVPILMLTGKDDPVDRVVGLELGVADYLVKPVLA